MPSPRNDATEHFRHHGARELDAGWPQPGARTRGSLQRSRGIALVVADYSNVHQHGGQPVSTLHHLFVCTSCRQPGEGRAPLDARAGARLFRILTKRYAGWAKREDISIVPFQCLSVCPRPCAVALRAPGKFTYVFGDIKPGETESAVIECATLYRCAPLGFLRREERPPALRAGILARVPPVEVR